MSPMDITNNIMEKIEIPEIFKKVETKGPYINFLYKIIFTKSFYKIKVIITVNINNLIDFNNTIHF